MSADGSAHLYVVSDDEKAVIEGMAKLREADAARIGHLEAERGELMIAKMNLLAELEKVRANLADEAKLRAEMAAALNAATGNGARLQASASEWEASAKHGWTVVQRRESALLALAQQLADLQHADFARETGAAAALRLPDMDGSR
jgi:hypothetical protein